MKNLKITSILLLTLLLIVMGAAQLLGAAGGTITYSIGPATGTTNSLYVIDALWTEDNGVWPAPTRNSMTPVTKDTFAPGYPAPGLLTLYGVGTGINFPVTFLDWTAKTDYWVGYVIFESVTQHYYGCLQAGSSGDAAPTWVPGGITPDKDIFWIDLGVNPPGAVQGGVFGAWVAQRQYYVGEYVLAGANYYQCIEPGISGATPPAWQTNGSSFDEGAPGTPTWQDLGTRVPAAASIGIPMHYVSGYPNRGGALYRAVVSGGVNMSSPVQQPNRPQVGGAPGAYMYIPSPNIMVHESMFPATGISNNLLWEPATSNDFVSGRQYPVWYASSFRGDSVTKVFHAEGYPYKDPVFPSASVTIFGSNTKTTISASSLDLGSSGSRDWLSAYPGNYPAGGNMLPDPLSIQPILQANANMPDDGTSSSEYVFRVHYYNGAGLPPIGWGWGSGVVLYLDVAGNNEYKPYPMYLEKGNLTDGDWVAHFTPQSSTFWITLQGHNVSDRYPGFRQAEDGSWFGYTQKEERLRMWAYGSLPIGTYHYFFGTSDDSLSFLHFQNTPLLFSQQPNLLAWGVANSAAYPSFNSMSPLDPNLDRSLVGYHEIDRKEGRRYTDPGNTSIALDGQIFVDREEWVPGSFEMGYEKQYPWKASEHPVSTCELTVPHRDNVGIAYDDQEKYGNARYYGTIMPFKHLVNPLMIGSTYRDWNGTRAQCTGATAATEVEFRILYKQLYNKAPKSIKVFINDANTRTKVNGISADVIDGVATDANANYSYSSYTMQATLPVNGSIAVPGRIYDPKTDTQPLDYFTGVWYVYRTKLKPGPHTYYFEADDGYNVCVWPRRPDQFTYDDPLNAGHQTTFWDWWVPTRSTTPQTAADLANNYDDNDYCPGPYINTPPTLSEPAVYKSSGKQGDTFRYSVVYKDADGQRPYSAIVYILAKDGAGYQPCEMRPDPSYNLNMTKDNRLQFRNGVRYIFDASTKEGDIAMQPGTRKYYFEFTDDWGMAIDPDDKVKGETVDRTTDGTKVKDGPIINENVPPRLTEGKIQSEDGTSNAATLWKYTVKYTDANNDPPSVIKLYIGTLQPDGKTILWNNGYTMLPTDTSNTVYSSGVTYYYRTRLSGPNAPDEPSLKYYYAFVANDGAEWARYHAISPSYESDETKKSSESASMVVAQSVTDSGAGYALNVPVTDTPEDANYPVSPVLGPLLVEPSTPANDITDAQLYADNSRMLVDDMKSGTPDVAIPRYSVMKGLAVKEDRTNSREYVVPDNPELIASIDGVYLTPDVNSSDNYYVDPLRGDDTSTGNVIQEDTLAVLDLTDKTHRTLIPSEPRKIGFVLGVYDDNGNNPGVNYAAGNIDSLGKIRLTANATNDFAGYTTDLKLRIRYKRTGFNPGDQSIWLTKQLPAELPADKVQGIGRVVYIKYQDLRFTHLLRGVRSEPFGLAYQLGVTDTNDPSGLTLLPASPDGGYKSATDNFGGFVFVQGVFDSANELPIMENSYLDPNIGPAQGSVSGYQMGDPLLQEGDPIAMTGVPALPMVQYLTNEVEPAIMRATVTGLTVTPEFPLLIGSNAVVGVYGDNQCTGTNFALSTDGETVNQVVGGTIALTQSPNPATVVFILYKHYGYSQVPSFLPDGSGTSTSVSIKGNNYWGITNPNVKRDLLGSIMGIWFASDNGSVTNFYDPRRFYVDDDLANTMYSVPMTWEFPSGTGLSYARYYQKGVYNIDRSNGKITFIDAAPAGTLTATYGFGRIMKDVAGKDITIKMNTSPHLSQGKVTPRVGARNTEYLFTVKYRDDDGPNGQAPTFVRVYIDDVPHEMAAVGAGATPAYKNGVIYSYTAQNLAGRPHTFRFEASDGASLVWLDRNPDPLVAGEREHRYDENNPTGKSLNDTVFDFFGPYVNDAPTLTNGAVNPPGNIGASDSIDYSVVYTDLDNDEPYTFDTAKGDSVTGKHLVDNPDSPTIVDADGKTLDSDVVGEPRVWIDSGTTDVTYLCKVPAGNSLVADPLEPSKKRTLNVLLKDGSTPTWTPGQFAGKLMQIDNGANIRRVYLIQSNTANTLTIAVDDLATDLKDYLDGSGNVKAGEPINFRINGLIMSPTDSADPNNAKPYTGGITYKITVPRLAVGAHKFHFTARGRAPKPDWPDPYMDGIRELPPYTVEVRNSDTDSNGPTVTSMRPDTNRPPVLSSKDIFYGPFTKAVNVVNNSRVKLDTSKNWTVSQVTDVRQLIGVYMNATLDANNSVTATNYLTTPVSSLATGNEAALTATMPAVAAGTTLVQFGNVDGDDTLKGDRLLRVVPDNADCIGSVVGVYLTPAMDGDNYGGTLADGKITLSTLLPLGTKQVYIKYLFKDGVVWPPVYTKYFRRTPASTTKFLSGDPLTFRVSYSDADNDPPTYRSGLLGYVKLVFNGTGVTKTMAPLADAADYLTPVPMTITATDVAAGVSKLHYEASDGYDVTTSQTFVRLPDVPANDDSIMVNYKPVLTAASLEPLGGKADTPFVFKVTYTDLDGATTTPSVKLRLTRIDGATPVELPLYTMTKTSGSITSGAVYTYTMPSYGLLAEGQYGRFTVAFEASDEAQPAKPIAVSDLVIRKDNNNPVIVDCDVSPKSGKSSTVFVYKAHYRDADGDPPVCIVSGTRYTGLTLTIDKKTNQKIVLYKSASETGTPDYTKAGGVLFETSPGVIGSAIGTGAHTYQIEASDDGKTIVTTGEIPNVPVLLVPYFENLRLVSASAETPTTAAAVTSAVVGDRALVEGLIKFPKAENLLRPDSTTSGITISITKPDGNIVTLEGGVDMTSTALDDTNNFVGRISLTNAAYAKGGDAALATGTDLTLSASGLWRVSAAKAADTTWDAAQTGASGIFELPVGGPMRTIAVDNPQNPDTSTPSVDMITPPMIIADGDIGRVFGYDWTSQMQVVRYDPQTTNYARYGNGPFPLLKPGEAVWIKPRTSYSAESIRQTDIDTGLLLSGNISAVLDAGKQYRVLHTFTKAYNTQVNSITGLTEYAPCYIQLHAGWNQFGNIFFNWRKVGNIPVTPREDVGIPFSELRVKYLNDEVSISEARSRGWIRDYAWRYDAELKQYVLVSATEPGAERTIKAWAGFWIRAFVDCSLVINPNTTYTGGTLAAIKANAPSTSKTGLSSVETETIDAPPPAPK